MRLTRQQLYERVTALAASGEGCSLADFLMAMRQNAQSHHGAAIRISDFENMLRDCLNGVVLDAKRMPAASMTGPRREFFAVIESQISDLQEIAESPQRNSSPLFFGSMAASGREWYNVEPRAFLECAAAGSFGYENSDPEPLEYLSWEDLTAFLLAGQSYE